MALAERVGLRMESAEATVETDRAGEERRDGDSGDDDRCSRLTDDTIDESRSFEGTFNCELVCGRTNDWDQSQPEGLSHFCFSLHY